MRTRPGPGSGSGGTTSPSTSVISRSSLKGRPVDLLEVGVFSGGSLDMWRAYLGEQANVYGVDIQPECREYEGPGKRIFIGDQADPAFWARFVADVPEVDIVIDDGGHQFHQQVATFEAIFPHIRPGGVYVCEDLTGEFNPFFDYVNGLSRGLQRYAAKPRGGGLGREPSAFQQSVDSVHLYPWMAVVEKRAERLDGLTSPRRGTEWQQFLNMKVFAKDKS